MHRIEFKILIFMLRSITNAYINEWLSKSWILVGAASIACFHKAEFHRSRCSLFHVTVKFNLVTIMVDGALEQDFRKFSARFSEIMLDCNDIQASITTNVSVSGNILSLS